MPSEIHNDFVSFMKSEVLPRRAANPVGIRLDGQTAGSSRDVAGRFRHNGVVWVVHADTRYEPLLLALAVAEKGGDPFMEDDTDRGKCLELRPEVRACQQSPYKYMYIYSWTE